MVLFGLCSMTKLLISSSTLYFCKKSGFFLMKSFKCFSLLFLLLTKLITSSSRSLSMSTSSLWGLISWITVVFLSSLFEAENTCFVKLYICTSSVVLKPLCMVIIKDLLFQDSKINVLKYSIAWNINRGLLLFCKRGCVISIICVVSDVSDVSDVSFCLFYSPPFFLWVLLDFVALILRFFAICFFTVFRCFGLRIWVIYIR